PSDDTLLPRRRGEAASARAAASRLTLTCSGRRRDRTAARTGGADRLLSSVPEHSAWTTALRHAGGHAPHGPAAHPRRPSPPGDPPHSDGRFRRTWRGGRPRGTILSQSAVQVKGGGGGNCPDRRRL